MHAEPEPTRGSDEHAPAGGRWRRIRQRLLALGLGLGLAALGGEVVLRIYNPLRSPARGNDIVVPVFKSFVLHNPDLPKISAACRRIYNSLGFRGPEPPADFASYLTLLTVGGSTTACWRLDQGLSWPDEDAEILGATRKKFWLNNAGYAGHSTFGHRILIDKYVRQLAPDFVLFLTGVNDLERGDLKPEDSQLIVAADSIRNRIIYHSELLSTIQSLLRYWRAVDLGVAFSDGLDQDWSTMERFAGPTKGREQLRAEHREFLTAYESRLRGIVASCREGGITPILMTQPAMYGRGVDPTTGVDIGPLSYFEKRSAAEQWDVLELYNDVVRSVARAEEIDCIDLAAEMPKDSKYFFDWVHYSIEGAKKVGQIVAARLDPILPR